MGKEMVDPVRRAELRDASDIARIQVDTWRSTYREIIDEEFLSNMSYDRGRRNWEATILDRKGTTSVYVAEGEQNQVVGFAACGPLRDSKGFGGELYAIYVVQNMQGNGVGGRLFLSAAKDLKSRGFDSMLVWVLADNPFKRFYESLEGKPVLTRDVVIGGKTLVEQGFGWRNLDSLVSRLDQDKGAAVLS